MTIRALGLLQYTVPVTSMVVQGMRLDTLIYPDLRAVPCVAYMVLNCGVRVIGHSDCLEHLHPIAKEQVLEKRRTSACSCGLTWDSALEHLHHSGGLHALEGPDEANETPVQR